MDDPLKGKVVLITGGTGSFGQKFVEIALNECNPKVIRIYSRGELLQVQMEKKFNSPKLRFFIGDVRDRTRLRRAMSGVNIVIHAAALKHVPICEYNPNEAVNTNIIGAMNVVECAIDREVEKVVGISSDKAVHPVNLYGATKMTMEKLFTQANIYSAGKVKFSCTRYGNVIGSRGSVVQIFQEQAKKDFVTLTDRRMTRFWITLEQGVRFVLGCLAKMQGGEILVPKLPSMRVTDLIDAIAPGVEVKVTGIRPGEKLAEILLTEDEARHAQEYESCYAIFPEFPFWTEMKFVGGKPLPENFSYRSDTNTVWLTKEQMKELCG